MAEEWPAMERGEGQMGNVGRDNKMWFGQSTLYAEVAADGLPLGLTEMLKNRQEGMNRWRLGSTARGRTATAERYTIARMAGKTWPLAEEQ